jgi:hypothetical protein
MGRFDPNTGLKIILCLAPQLLLLTQTTQGIEQRCILLVALLPTFGPLNWA